MGGGGKVEFYFSSFCVFPPRPHDTQEQRREIRSVDDASLRCCGIIPRKKELEIKLFRFEGKMMAEKSFGGFIMTMLCSYVVAVIAERGDGG